MFQSQSLDLSQRRLRLHQLYMYRSRKNPTTDKRLLTTNLNTRDWKLFTAEALHLCDRPGTVRSHQRLDGCFCVVRLGVSARSWVCYGLEIQAAGQKPEKVPNSAGARAIAGRRQYLNSIHLSFPYLSVLHYWRGLVRNEDSWGLHFNLG